MTTNSTANEPQHLSTDEIEQTFDQLELTDPEVREYYQDLDKMNPSDNRQYWIQIHTTSSIPSEPQCPTCMK